MMLFIPFYIIALLVAIGGNEDTYLIMDKYCDFIDWFMEL